MKPQHKEWAKLRPRREPPKAIVPAVMRDVPSVRKIEDILLLYTGRLGHLTAVHSNKVDETCREIFGITNADTEFCWPARMSDLSEIDPEYWEIGRRYDEHEERFEICKLNLWEQVPLLRALGLDFADEFGRPLLCLEHFNRAAEAATKRMPEYPTKLPTSEEVTIAKVASNLQREADAFQRSKLSRKGNRFND